ncbi:hypothetical protein LshimejAT787_1005300 [Lyophyllum shimeji]|uniref:Uncharacterized protein n=1 Tax=Lyophyllum shimeji TaxID=47721 RepID=A0A9P3PTX7_LYOSH|nr:hypothetical protein LshimejAT787_1005300 [Lyophyllum shimeji]
MLYTKASLIVTLLAAFATSAASGPAQETNGQRMARGLPPLAPKFGRNVPGRSGVRRATPAGAAKRNIPSGLPPIPYSGRLEARKEDGSVLGIVKNSNCSSPIGGLNLNNTDQDLLVAFNAPAHGRGPFDIIAINPLFTEPYYVGAAGTTLVNTLDLTSKNTLAFTNVQQTAANSIPVLFTFNDTLLVESAIWSIHRKTREITAHYVNGDGTKPDTIIAYDATQNVLFFVGNITAYNENNDSPASAIKLFLVPS